MWPKFLGLIPTFVKVTEEKLIGRTFCTHPARSWIRLVSSERGCISCLTRWRKIYGLGSSEFRKIQENPWSAWNYRQVPDWPPKMNILTIVLQNCKKSIFQTCYRKKKIYLILTTWFTLFCPPLLKIKSIC